MNNEVPQQMASLILLDEVDCEGTESNIADCRHGEWEPESCYVGTVSLRCSQNEYGKRQIFCGCFVSTQINVSRPIIIIYH